MCLTFSMAVLSFKGSREKARWTAASILQLFGVARFLRVCTCSLGEWQVPHQKQRVWIRLLYRRAASINDSCFCKCHGGSRSRRCDEDGILCLWMEASVGTNPNESNSFKRIRSLAFSDVGDWFLETWLILPVVICLSQRLSHACLSISILIAKLRMAH